MFLFWNILLLLSMCSIAFSNVFCPEEIIEDSRYGVFRFPRTEATDKYPGNKVRIECPFGFRDDGFEPFLHQFATITTESKSEISGVIRHCHLRTKTNEDGTIESYGKWIRSVENNSEIKYCKEEDWEEGLQLWLAKLKTVTPYTFLQLGPVITRMSQYAEDDYDCAVALINGIAELLVSPQLNGEVDGISITPEQRSQLFNVTEAYSHAISLKLKPGFKVQVGNAGIIIENAKFHSQGQHSIQNQVLQAYDTKLEFPSNSNYPADNMTKTNTNIMVNIPAEALKMSLDQTDNPPELKITAYSHEIFNEWNKHSELSSFSPYSTCLPTASKNFSFGCEFSEDGCQDGNRTYKTWGLVCIELDGEIKDLAEPVEFFIQPESLIDQEEYQYVCVYWDDTEQNWSTNGVITTQSKTGIKCTSSHLSVFSALIEPFPLPFPDSQYAPINNSIHGFILSILSSIGSVCSIVGLTLTLFTYAIFRSLRRERSNRILINLCCSLLLLHIISVSGSKSLWDGHCFFPATSLHYLVLTSLAWMMVEAVHMYDLLISVFVRPENRFLIKRFVLAWGIPLIIVGVCAAIHPEVYRVGRADMCLMSAHANIYMYYAAYIFPIGIILVVNLIIFCRIFRVLYKQTKRTRGGTTTSKFQTIKISPMQIKGATAVFVLLGIGWVLGLLAIGPFEVFFRYMYCVVNAGQGLLIFLFRVALNPHACKQWKKVMLGLSPDSSLDVSDATSSTNTKKFRRKSTAISPSFISASNSVENSLTASNPLSTTLATTLASILKSEKENKSTNFSGIN